MVAKKTNKKLEVSGSRNKKPRKAPVKKAKSVKDPKKSTKTAKQTKSREEEELEDMFPAAMRLGDTLWEYRARMAEWEKAFSDNKFTTYKLDKEKSDPKYQKLLLLQSQDAQMRAEVKRTADLLRKVQEKAAENLGLSIEEFLKNCTIDHETGVVRYLD